MTIAFACSGCEQKLKVKDELAGRKVKCPGCAKVIVVPQIQTAAVVDDAPPRKQSRPAADEAPTERPPKKKREEDVEEAELEERPRKKKKKKKNNAMRWIAGASLLLLLLILVLVWLLWPSAQSQAKTKPPDPPKAKPIQKEPEIVQERPKEGLRRGMDLQEIKNIMVNLGRAYHNYASGSTSGRGPASREALEDLYEKNASINNALISGWIVVIWGASLNNTPEGSSNTILAYEKEADSRGQRVVLFVDSHVDMLLDEEFQKAPKAQGTK